MIVSKFQTGADRQARWFALTLTAVLGTTSFALGEILESQVLVVYNSAAPDATTLKEAYPAYFISACRSKLMA